MRRELLLKRRLHSLSTLKEAVGAMKSLSAHHFRQARQAVEPARAYRQGVEPFVGWAEASLPAGDGPPGLLILGAELGLCGSYHTHTAEAGVRRRRELGPGPTFCVGSRASSFLGRLGVEVTAHYPGPSSVQGITPLLLRLAEDLLTTYAQQRLQSLDIVSNPFKGVGSSHPAPFRLLPLQSKSPVSHRRLAYTSADGLASAAIREFLYVTLYDLLLDALASEHGARLVATDTAEKWLDQRIERLRRHLAATRREASTQEVIEIATGAQRRRKLAVWGSAS